MSHVLGYTQLDHFDIYMNILIEAIYNSGGTVIKSDETEVGEQWWAVVTPFSVT